MNDVVPAAYVTCSTLFGDSEITPVHVQRERVQGARIGDRPGQSRRTVLVNRRCRQAAQHRGHVVDRHRRRATGRAGVVVGNRQADGVSVAGRGGWVVVQVLVSQREGCCTGRIRNLLDIVRRQQVTPVHVQRERVQRARIGDRPGQSRRAVLVNRRCRQAAQHRGHVVDRHRRRVTGRAGVVVGKRQADGVSVAGRGGRVVVQVLVSQREGCCTGRIRNLLDIVRRQRITPVHVQRERVQGARIGDRPGQSRRTVLVNRRCRQAAQHRGHVVNRHRRRVTGRAGVVVGNRQADGVSVAGRGGRVVVQVLVSQRERCCTGRK